MHATTIITAAILAAPSALAHPGASNPLTERSLCWTLTQEGAECEPANIGGGDYACGNGRTTVEQCRQDGEGVYRWAITVQCESPTSRCACQQDGTAICVRGPTDPAP
ncbi:hypothetical protein SLS62_011109 [Diatrype stigma]|uniref:Uncharacterized protein n=1 Tax=Diatrype stigma TaxID=117547 RepID=A0AAN9UDT8_9PEZI